MSAIAILLITAAIGSTPATGGIVIPASPNIKPSNVPIKPNPKAKFPKSIMDFLLLQKVYELVAAATKKYDGTTTIAKLITSYNEPIPPVFAEPSIHAPTRVASAIAIFNIFILFPYLIS